MWKIDLSESTALVTGASRGIGKAIAIGLAEAGAAIVAVARSEGPLRDLANSIAATGGSCLPLPGDLSKPDEISRVAAGAADWRGPPDVLVNAAGIIIRHDPPDVEADEFDLMMAVNVRAPFLLSQEIGWAMRQAGGGSILNITSLAGEEVTKAPLHYQASKAALIQMTRGFASRLGPEVRVNAIGPGYIETSLNEEWLSDDENRRYVEEQTAASRVGTPDDVVGLAVYLASSASSYVTGQHFRVDGGWGL